jgi:hypothetical protein
MAKYLLLADPHGAYQLPEDTDVDGLRARLREAMESGAVLEVDYEAGDDGLARSTVMLNGSALAAVSVVETQEPDAVD